MNTDDSGAVVRTTFNARASKTMRKVKTPLIAAARTTTRTKRALPHALKDVLANVARAATAVKHTHCCVTPGVQLAELLGPLSRCTSICATPCLAKNRTADDILDYAAVMRDFVARALAAFGLPPDMAPRMRSSITASHTTMVSLHAAAMVAGFRVAACNLCHEGQIICRPTNDCNQYECKCTTCKAVLVSDSKTHAWDDAAVHRLLDTIDNVHGPNTAVVSMAAYPRRKMMAASTILIINHKRDPVAFTPRCRPERTIIFDKSLTSTVFINPPPGLDVPGGVLCAKMTDSSLFVNF